MGILFGTEQWIEAYKESVNSSKAYEDAAKTWEGDFVFVCEPAGNLDHEIRMYIDLWHGKIGPKGARILNPSEEVESEFVYSGPWTNWEKLLQKKIDPIQGLMQGKFKLKGNMGKVMRAVKAAQELVNCVVAIDTDLY
ncbi:MAG: SCP2 sterol-binding domain-containing protein [Candidatus Lokiarchaeota archaeon]|nr:SCP2 sterol-binding domain-containing protein [Candidatus Lokiarchaeota archaeon]